MLVGPGRLPLDHYQLVLANGCIAVAYGNEHDQNMYLGYVKYCRTTGPTPWKDARGVHYVRLLDSYGPTNVRAHTPWSIYLPHYDSWAPYIPASEVVALLDPIERAQEIVRSPRDPLEERALMVLEDLYDSAGIPSSCVGITGSILPRIHNPRVSDVDLVVYGHWCSLRVIEAVSEGGTSLGPLSGPMADEWARSNALRLGISERLARALYRPWRRGIAHGTLFSITYSDDVPRRLFSQPARRGLGRVRAEVSLSGGPRALSYPTISEIENYRLVEGHEPPLDVRAVISFESLFVPALLEGGRALVEGLLLCGSDDCLILVGGSEHRGFVEPLAMS
ncbi:MAG: hypothetical protein ABWK00_05300 [Desulfurococcaceae archaeon]